MRDGGSDMNGAISLLQWIIDNWQIIATAFSSVSSIALFFMHGSARSELQEIRDFINSVSVSQPKGPVDTSAKAVQEQQNPKV
jgi:hypothetical protein